jgi:hypothetical protein
MRRQEALRALLLPRARRYFSSLLALLLLLRLSLHLPVLIPS